MVREECDLCMARVTDMRQWERGNGQGAIKLCLECYCYAAYLAYPDAENVKIERGN